MQKRKMKLIQCRICKKWKCVRSDKNAQYCSRKCFGKSISVGRKECLCCTKKVMQTRNRFCSRKCAEAFRHNLSIKNVVCEECGIKFKRYRCHIRKTVLCSMRCRGKWASKNMVGKASPRWSGPPGTVVLRVCGGGLRNWIKKSDGLFTQNYRKILNDSGIEIPKGHIVHHKDGNPLNDTLLNLEILSRKDHLRKHQELRQKA